MTECKGGLEKPFMTVNTSEEVIKTAIELANLKGRRRIGAIAFIPIDPKEGLFFSYFAEPMMTPKERRDPEFFAAMIEKIVNSGLGQIPEGQTVTYELSFAYRLRTFNMPPYGPSRKIRSLLVRTNLHQAQI